MEESDKAYIEDMVLYKKNDIHDQRYHINDLPNHSVRSNVEIYMKDTRQLQILYRCYKPTSVCVSALEAIHL